MTGPKPAKIRLTRRQKANLSQIAQKKKAPLDQILRANIILLADQDFNNTEIALQLSTTRGTARKWRSRWAEALPALKIFEKGDATKRELFLKIEHLLEDEYRSGKLSKFTAEQLTQIIAPACQSPMDVGIPITHWTSHDLANHVIKTGIVDSISSVYIGKLLQKTDLKPHRVKYWETSPPPRSN